MDKHKLIFLFVLLFIGILITNVSAIDIDSCGPLNVENTIYTLNTSIAVNGDCFSIQANNITLDFDGYNITGDGTGSGVNFDNYNETIIKDGYVYNFSDGIIVTNSKENVINNMTSSFNGDYGIYIDTSNNNTLINVNASSNRYGFYLISISDNNFVNITASSNTVNGFLFYNSLNNNLTDITANSNNYGFYLISSSNNTLTNVNASSSGVDGIYIEDASNYNTLTNVNASLNWDDGIHLCSNSNFNIITNVIANSNTENGIYIHNGSNNNLTDIVINLNHYGIYISDSSNYNALENVDASSNVNDGIYFYRSSNNNLTDITASSNTRFGIYIDDISNYNTLENVNASSNYFDGIYIYDSSNYNTLENVNASSNGEDGINLYYVSNNNLTDITTNLNYYYGIYLYGSSNNILTNITANLNDDYGIYLYTYSNNNVIDNLKATSNDYNLYFNGDASHNIIKNSVLTTPLIKNIVTGVGSENNTILNTTYDITTELSDGEIIRKWYFDAQVNSSHNGSSINQANVTAYNITNNTEFSVLTDSDGKTSQELIEYINNGGTRTYHTPHTINTSKTGYITNSTIYNLTIEHNVFHEVSLTSIISTETLIQGQAIEEVRVPWEFNDNWTVEADSPVNWTNVTETYNLPTDCADVYIEIDGVNASDLVNSTLCDYTVRNNKTLEPSDSSLINITYTTTATTSSEGDWIASNKRICQKTHWINYLTINNPSTQDYINISINMTTDKYAVPETINVTIATDVFTHTFNDTNGNVNWTLPSLDSEDDEVFTIKYKTPNITLTKVNYSETISGKDYEIYNVTIEANSTRDILLVLSYFSFSDEGVMSNRLYKCADGLVECTEDISNRADVVWEDQDSDGSYDYVEWYVTNLTQNQSYQLKNDKGFPIEITISKEILNKPIYAFDNIQWRTTITMYNPNAVATEKVYKYEFPFGSVDIKLDDINKNLQFDPFGRLAPYITIIDKDQSGDYPNSVYLAPGETKTFIVEYRTSSVTVYPSTYFPDYFEVDENALIVQVLRIKNQAEDDVTDVEYKIPIDYAEDLIVCEGEYENGCPDEDSAEYKEVIIDTQSSVKGDYVLEIDEIDSGETMYVTLSYYTPTAIIKNIERGKRSVQGNLTTYKKLTIESQARFTMSDLRYREKEISCEEVVDILKCRPSGICDISIGYECPLRLKLGTLGMGETLSAYIWYIEEEEKVEPTFIDEVIDWFVENIWEGGKKIEIKGLWKYIAGWMASKDIETGELYITTGRLILIGSIIGLIIGFVIWIALRRRKKSRKEIKNI